MKSKGDRSRNIRLTPKGEALARARHVLRLYQEDARERRGAKTALRALRSGNDEPA